MSQDAFDIWGRVADAHAMRRRRRKTQAVAVKTLEKTPTRPIWIELSMGTSVLEFWKYHRDQHNAKCLHTSDLSVEQDAKNKPSNAVHRYIDR